MSYIDIMINPELETMLESVSDVEKDLISRSLQRITMEYIRAIELDGEEGGHLQRAVIETPEPTIVFRMDSKNEYLTNGELVRRSLYFYVPEDFKPDTWVNKYWIKTVDKDGSDTMYSVGIENGVRVHDKSDVIQAELTQVEETDVDVFEFSSEQLIEDIILAKQQAIVGLKTLAHAVREEFIHVKFNS